MPPAAKKSLRPAARSTRRRSARLPPNRTIVAGDVLTALRDFPPNSIDMVLTSPPYWQLRSYAGATVAEQWGREPTFHEYLAHIAGLMAELKRIVKPAGTVWLNIGDVYSAGAPAADPARRRRPLHKPQGRKWPYATSTPDHAARTTDVAKKSLIGLPHRIFVQTIDSGWLARNDAIWHKSSAMPSSVKDRLTTLHEHIFIFSRQERYHFDLDAVRRLHKTEPIQHGTRLREALAERARRKPWLPGNDGTDHMSEQDERDVARQATLFASPSSASQPPRRARRNHTRAARKMTAADDQIIRAHSGNKLHGRSVCDPRGKNPGDVLSFRPTPSPRNHGSHVAAFPVTLAQWCLACGCPPGGIALDPFMGSGTVALAAERLGRRWIGIELSDEYRAEAERRLAGFHNERLADLSPPPNPPPPEGVDHV